MYKIKKILPLLIIFIFSNFIYTQEKEWTFIVYMAADNDLNYFAKKNIEEMKLIGSNDTISILIQYDGQGGQEKTQRLLIEKNNVIHVNKYDASGYQKFNSGSAQTLIDCCKWAIESYPAKQYALILWNHGIGILDSIGSKSINPSSLFTFNPTTHLLELNRSINFMEYLQKQSSNDTTDNDNISNDYFRGICFSDTYNSYLTNQKLDYALNIITQDILKGKKIAIIGCDACMMAMTEIAHLFQPYADFLVASQEVELGTGWPYTKILEIFNTEKPNSLEFAKHIVSSYAKHYSSITKDFTQSAIDLSQLQNFENIFNETCELFLEAVKNESNATFIKAIKACRSKRVCTYFSEPSYIDLYHFIQNIETTIEYMSFIQNDITIKTNLKTKITELKKQIKKIIVANNSGESLPDANGLSIYFPYRKIEHSYSQTPFAKKIKWIQCLQCFL